MRRVLSVLILTVISFSGFSQMYKSYLLFGKMVKGRDILTGYFRFDNEIVNQRQIVHYRESWRGEEVKLYANKYDYFESDSIYMETVPYGLGGGLMIPRIINGKIQLFEVLIEGRYYLHFDGNENIYAKKGGVKMRIRKSKFKKQMHELLADDPSLLEKIDNDELKFENIKEIILAYNNNFATQL